MKSATTLANAPIVQPKDALAILDDPNNPQDPSKQVVGKLPFDLADISRLDNDQLPDYAQAYFAAILDTMTLKQAADRIGYHPATIFAARRRIPAFDTLVSTCLAYRQEFITSELEQVGLGRALGTDGKGKISDQLVMFFLKGNAPGKYRERHTGGSTGGLKVDLNFNYTVNGGAGGDSPALAVSAGASEVVQEAVVVESKPKVKAVKKTVRDLLPADVVTKKGSEEW